MDRHLKSFLLMVWMMIVEITCKLTSIGDTSSAVNEEVLAWVRRAEVQRDQNTMLDSLKEDKELGTLSYVILCMDVSHSVYLYVTWIFLSNRT